MIGFDVHCIAMSMQRVSDGDVGLALPVENWFCIVT